MSLCLTDLRTGPLPKIINGLFFYIGWGALIAGAAEGHPWYGSLLVVVALIFHFVVAQSRLRDLTYMSVIALIGLALDTIFLHAGLLSYASPNSWLPLLAPLWLLLLYAQFASAIDQSMIWMQKHPLIALVAGPFGGITSYSAAAQLGAVSFLQSRFTVLATIGAAWLIFLPAAFWFSRYLNHRQSAQ